MPAKEMLYDVPLFVIALALLGILLAAAEIGFRGARRRVAEDVKEAEGAAFSTIQNAILGLLALLLAFTYSLASGHFDARKQNVVNEANAIGTAWLRAGLIEQPARGELQELLRRYVDLRLDFARAPIFAARTNEAALAAERLHGEIWAVVARNAPAGTPSPLDATLVLAVNEVIDMHATRLHGLRDHVPEIVLFLLMFVATVALGIVGFAAGCRGKRNLVLTVMLSLLIVAVIDVTMDLDRPRRGLITISQQSMLELRASLNPPR